MNKTFITSLLSILQRLQEYIVYHLPIRDKKLPDDQMLIIASAKNVKEARGLDFSAWR